jgi:hypothetical protein
MNARLKSKNELSAISQQLSAFAESKRLKAKIGRLKCVRADYRNVEKVISARWL